jgi:KRAB domain-containing zinc finger protein
MAVENDTRLRTKPGGVKIIKFEDTELREIKAELDDTPDKYDKNMTDNTTFSNYNEMNHRELYCDICATTYNTNEKYLMHNYYKHKNRKAYDCELCKEQFSLSIHLNLHMTQHVREILLKPSSSNLPTETQSSSNSNLVMSLRKKNNKLAKSTKSYCETNTSVIFTNKPNLDPFKCTECSYSTVDQSQFINHFSICSGETNTDAESKCCHLCFKPFRNQSALNGHMKYHSVRGEITSRKKKTMNVSNHKTNGSVLIAQRVIRVKNPIIFFTCKYCSKKFMTKHKLHIHILQHKKQMVCKVCNQTFLFKKSFDKHLLSHKTGTLTDGKKSKYVSSTTKNKTQNPVEQLSCAICKNSFSSKKSLLYHNTMMHSDSQMSYSNSKSPLRQCNWCNRIITKSNLLRHIRNFHPKAKPIKCQICPMKFKDVFSMRFHFSENHGK